MTPRSRAQRPRLVARLAGLVVMVALAILGLALAAPGARADSGDRIDSMTAKFEVNAQGVVHVTETVVYRFGSPSSQRGIVWTVLTREKWTDEQDAVYRYDNFRVTSPTQSTQYQASTITQDSGRTTWTRYKIGDPNRMVHASTATYTISYDLHGALRPEQGYDEFSWDVVNSDTPPIANLAMTVTVPGGVRAVTCFDGPVGTKNACTSATVIAGAGQYKVASKQTGDTVSIGAMITHGAVANAAPTLEPRGDKLAQQVSSAATLALPVALLAPPIIGLLLIRRNRDDRFVGLPPGVTPAGGQQTHVAQSGKIEIPVAFSPPRIPVADAGYLYDGAVDQRETAATLVEMAVQGAVKMGGDDNDAWVELVDPARATSPQQQVLLDAIFVPDGRRAFGQPGSLRTAVGTSASLGTAGQLNQVQSDLRRMVIEEARANGWYTRLPGAAGGSRLGCLGVVGALLVSGLLFGNLGKGVHLDAGSLSGALPMLAALVGVLVVSVVATAAWVRARTAKGRRSATGRALVDQIEGFRTYLATAEAEQLRFEEGEDIYSKYLPWAIIFDLTDRWAKVCQRLVELGRLSDQPPGWYAGNPYMWNYFWFNDQIGHVTTAASPPIPEPSSGGSGWGGGSSFGGGGFSGGGGGGTSIGSW